MMGQTTAPPPIYFQQVPTLISKSPGREVTTHSYDLLGPSECQPRAQEDLLTVQVKPKGGSGMTYSLRGLALDPRNKPRGALRAAINFSNGRSKFFPLKSSPSPPKALPAPDAATGRH